MTVAWFARASVKMKEFYSDYTWLTMSLALNSVENLKNIL